MLKDGMLWIFSDRGQSFIWDDFGLENFDLLLKVCPRLEVGKCVKWFPLVASGTYTQSVSEAPLDPFIDQDKTYLEASWRVAVTEALDRLWRRGQNAQKSTVVSPKFRLSERAVLSVSKVPLQVRNAAVAAAQCRPLVGDDAHEENSACPLRIPFNNRNKETPGEEDVRQ
jgi:hypothetical protein